MLRLLSPIEVLEPGGVQAVSGKHLQVVGLIAEAVITPPRDGLGRRPALLAEQGEAVFVERVV